MGADILEPYRVDWRLNANASYCLGGEYASYVDAHVAAKEGIRKWKGECRVIEQHVIEEVK